LGGKKYSRVDSDIKGHGGASFRGPMCGNKYIEDSPRGGGKRFLKGGSRESFLQKAILLIAGRRDQKACLK